VRETEEEERRENKQMHKLQNTFGRRREREEEGTQAHSD
jgi:hypothetical protein